MGKAHPLLAFVLIFILLAWVGPGLSSAALVTYTGFAQITGPLQVDLSVTPPISQPGDTLQVTLRLLNRGMVTVTPELLLELPGGLSLDRSLLPAGTTLNLQTNALNWLPLALANGGVQEVALRLHVEAADITRPEQAVTVALRHEGTEQRATATIWIGVAPQVHALLTPPQAAVGQPLQLRALLNGSGPFTQVWQLGDGRRVAVNDPLVVYPVAGIYDITLEAGNPLATASLTRPITIVPHPAAQFVPDDTTPGVGQTVTFISQSGGQPPLQYHWQLGDGTTSSVASPSHQYQAPGVYQVHLVVQNGFGRSEAYGIVTVGQPPVADIILPVSASAGQPVPAQAFGDDTVTQFLWDMGDGRAHEGEQISHVYTQTGDFYVTMTAVNDYGGRQVGQWIHVEPGMLSHYLPLVVSGGEFTGLEAEEADPFMLSLEPVELDETFVLESNPALAGRPPAEQLFAYINEARGRFDLPPLAYVYELSLAAQQHATDMAANAYTGHAGSDGSFPAERLLQYGYGGGYAGEATAWGFAEAYQAVEFWVNSPAHRRIILNRYATDVGVAYTASYDAPNVWYWTAEFGNAYGGAIQPLIRVQDPVAGLEAMITSPVVYRWNWPAPLTPEQRFVVYLYGNGRSLPLGTVTQPVQGSQYAVEAVAAEALAAPGSFEWQVRLESGNSSVAESERRSIVFALDPNAPTATPVITATVTPTPLPALTPTATPTPTSAWPTQTPLPPPPTLPPLVTATPLPTPTVEE